MKQFMWVLLLLSCFVSTAFAAKPPKAKLKASVQVGDAPLTVEFDASQSTSDGTITTYYFDFGDGTSTSSSTPKVTHTFYQIGDKIITLKITDTFNLTDQTTEKVKVKGTSNIPPVARITSTSTSGPIPLTVNFSGATSSDQDGTISSYSWSFGDGTSATGANVTHTFTSVGNFTVTLTVTDNLNASASTTMVISTTSGANQSPIPQFQETQSGTQMQFDSFGSYDPDGYITNYHWDFGDGNSADGLFTTHQYAIGGTYQVTLTLTDNLGAQGSLTKPVFVASSGNQPPVAAMTILKNGLSISADSLGSYDPDGYIIMYQWNFSDGGYAEGPNTPHTFASSGTYSVTLTVYDNQFRSTSITESVTVTGGNQSPVASFNHTEDGLTTNLNGNASYDPDGSIVLYQWNFSDGGYAEGPTASHTFASAGTYTATLTVFDNELARSSTTQTITISGSSNQLPIAAFTHSENVFTTNLDALGSFDPDGYIIMYQWTFSDGGFSEGPTASHLFPGAGTYQVTLTIFDNQFARASVTQNVTVTGSAGNLPPVSSFNFAQVTTTPPYQFSFNGSASHDPDGSIVSYEWNFGDQTTGTGVTTNHSYSNAGVYMVSLKVTDNQGTSTSYIQEVLIGTNISPIANFNFVITPNSNPYVVNFNATDSNDPDGSIVSYQWNFGDGNTDSGVILGHDYQSAGSFSVTLTVIDNLGKTGSITKNVIINAQNQSPQIFDFSIRTRVGIAPVHVSAIDPDGQIELYKWFVNDQLVKETPFADDDVIIELSGANKIKLTVVDNQGAETSLQRTYNFGPDFPELTNLNFSDGSLDNWVTVGTVETIERCHLFETFKNRRNLNVSRNKQFVWRKPKLGRCDDNLYAAVITSSGPERFFGALNQNVTLTSPGVLHGKVKFFTNETINDGNFKDKFKIVIRTFTQSQTILEFSKDQIIWRDGAIGFEYSSVEQDFTIHLGTSNQIYSFAIDFIVEDVADTFVDSGMAIYDLEFINE